MTSSQPTIEDTTAFMPRFDGEGLLPAIVTDQVTGEVLMFAFMNREALERTLATREAHFWSRSRKKIWKKGEDSGNVLKIAEIRTDCDQDVLWIKAHIAGAGVACHTGARSCFYRRVEGAGKAQDGAFLVFANAKTTPPKG